MRIFTVYANQKTSIPDFLLNYLIDHFGNFTFVNY